MRWQKRRRIGKLERAGCSTRRESASGQGFGNGRGFARVIKNIKFARLAIKNICLAIRKAAVAIKNINGAIKNISFS